MKRSFGLFALAALAASVGLTGCDASAPTAPPPAAQVIVPQARPEGAAKPPAGETAPAAAPAPTPRLVLAQGERLLDMIDTNLDLDAPDEQILVVQAGEDQPIRLLVADYDEIRQTWQRAVDYATQATNAKVFRVATEDIIGDYVPEIVAHGLTADAQTTLDVLRRAPASPGTGLAFASIVRLSADRSITIDRHRRPQSYQFGQRYDESFPIIVERKDPEADNPLDVLRETWHWRNQERRYTRTLLERVPGELQAQKQLAELFSASATQTDYEQFLEGPWHRRNDVKSLLVFDERTLRFFDGEVQEIYRIDFFSRWGNTVRLEAHNLSLQQIKKWITLSVVAANTLRLEVRNTPWVAEDDPWSGEYLRLAPDVQQSILAQRNPRAARPAVRLVGIFRAVDGAEIAFDSPTFTWVTPDGGSSGGGFAVMEGLPVLNTHYLERETPDQAGIISFKFLDQAGLKSTDRTYLLEYKEKVDATTVVRTVSLTPVSLTIRGALATSREPLVLEQIEMKSESAR